MSRIDIPTLKCDRCRSTTTDGKAMSAYRRLVYDHMSGHDEWDLCPMCWTDFIAFFIKGDTTIGYAG